MSQIVNFLVNVILKKKKKKQKHGTSKHIRQNEHQLTFRQKVKNAAFEKDFVYFSEKCLRAV